MGDTKVLLLAACAVLVAMGGCLGADADLEPDAGTGPANGDDGAARGTATLEGLVVTVDFDPVAGADVLVALGGALVTQATTDDRGRYKIEDLEPGDYVIQVNAHCCRQAVSRIVLEAGATVKLDVRMEPLPRIVPFVLEEIWTGHVGCSGWLPAAGLVFNPEGICAETDPNNDPILAFELEPRLRTVVVAMEWEPVLTNLREDLRLRMHKGPAEFFTLNGPSPFEFYLGPEDAAAGPDLYFDQIEDPWEVRFTVTAAETGNVVYQQPFTLHYHLYYVAPAPEGTSALPT